MIGRYTIDYGIRIGSQGIGIPSNYIFKGSVAMSGGEMIFVHPSFTFSHVLLLSY